MVIIGATIFLGFIISALFKVALSAGNFNDEGLKQTRARYAALAAINRAFAELDRNPGWRRGWPDEEPLPQNPNLRYKLKVLDEVTASQVGGEGDDTIAGAADEVYLFAQGFTEEGAGKALAAMGGTAYRPGAQVGEVCFADGDLLLDGGSVDGFDSRIGDHWYNPTETDPNKLTLVGKSGHVGGNDDIQLNGLTVDGDLIMPDPGSFTLGGTRFRARNNTNVQLNGATILGDQKTPDYPREIAEVTPPFEDTATAVIDEAAFDLLVDSTDNAGAKILDPGAYLSVVVPDSKTVELQSGIYYFQESFSLDGATVVLHGSGPVKVFIGETLVVQNSTINPSAVDPDNKNRKPADLQLLFADKKIYEPTGEEYSVLDVSGSSVNAVVIGANLQARINGTQFFGAVQADAIQASNSNFHYDEALQSLEIDDFSKWKLRGLTALPPGTNL